MAFLVIMAFSTYNSSIVFHPSSVIARFLHEKPSSFPFINQTKKRNLTKLVLHAKSSDSSSLNNNSDEDVSRPIANFTPSTWGDYFTRIPFPPEIIHKYPHGIFPLVPIPFINQTKKRNLTKLVLNAKSPDSSSLNNNPDEDVSRPIANFTPSTWGDYFTRIPFPPELDVERHAVLKEKVEEILEDSTTKDTLQRTELIDTLCRIGVSYHFESEIEDQLQKMFASLSNTDFDHYDLFTTSLLFRVFRQHGYKIPCDVFLKFKDSDGKFKESSMVMDIKGMLSLYEASHLRIHGEDILDEALAFTTASLKELLAAQPSHPLAGQVSRALDQPIHMCFPRLETRHYISVYQEDKHRNETLLEFAKVDFNCVQMLHREELQDISIWWRDIKSDFPYVRDRIVEAYFLMMGLYFEPHYARARVMLCKFLAITSLLDDTYDAYGTLEELQCLTDAIERWDYSAIDELPNYMKKLYNILLDYFDEVGKEVAREGRDYSIYHAREEMKNLLKSYFLESKWYYEGYEPSFDEYLDNAQTSAGCTFAATASLVGMKDANENAFKWFRTEPKIIMGSNAVSRLMDDIVSRKTEKQRGHVATGIELYAKKYGVTEDEAIEAFNKMLDNAWKDMNEDCLKPTAVPMQALLRVLNMSRSIYVAYKHDDGYTNSGKIMKGYINSLFIEPIPI